MLESIILSFGSLGSIHTLETANGGIPIFCVDLSSSNSLETWAENERVTLLPFPRARGCEPKQVV
jgi:hypothetical protein